MPHEVALFDLLLPSLFLAFVASAVLQVLVDRLLGWSGVYGRIWHPPLFRLSIFICIFGVIGLLMLR